MLGIKWRDRTVWRKRYTELAVIALNVLLFLTVLNALAAFALDRFPERVPAPPRTPPAGYVSPVVSAYGYSEIRPRYPSLSDDSFNLLMWETWTRQYAYEPYTDFKERAFQGTYVNIAPAGFRVGYEQGPWPPAAENFNIFLFGGSTTFGYGLADQQALGSVLQQALHAGRPVKIYNFGRAYYISTQERVLFENLLHDGFVPNAALFVDGLNDFYNTSGLPPGAAALAAAIPGKQVRSPAQQWFGDLALTRLFRRLTARTPAWSGAGGDLSETITDPSAGLSDPANIDRVIQGYLRNRKLEEAAARALGVNILFVWQPVPTYRHQSDGALTKNLGKVELSGKGYPVLKEYTLQNPLGANFVWCADVMDGATGVLYLDAVHYAPRGIELLTQCIQKGAETSRLLE